MKRTTLLLAALTLLAALPAGAEPTHRAIIEIQKKATSNGEISMIFQADDAEAQTISVAVAKGQKRKFIAEAVMAALNNVVDARRYRVNHKDEGKINVEGIKDAVFELTLEKQSVTGLSVVVNTR